MTELCDYCKRCVDVYGCERSETLTEPFQIDWNGSGTMLAARYYCGRGHVWTCHWSAELLDNLT